MDAKITREQIMAYLYGEMPAEEARLVEAYLEENPAMKAEYEDLYEVRKGLKQIKDVDVAPPMVMFTVKDESGNALRLFHNPFIQKMTAVAASLLLLLFIGKLTGLQITYQQNAVTIGFNQPEKNTPLISNTTQRSTTQTTSINMDSIQQRMLSFVNDFHIKENKNLMLRLKAIEGNVNKMDLYASNTTKVVSPNNLDLNDKNLEILANKVSQQNLLLLSEVIEASSARQEDYIKTLFADFAIYIHDQRMEDLNNIQANMNNIKQVADKKSFETDMVISRLIETVIDKNY